MYSLGERISYFFPKEKAYFPPIIIQCFPTLKRSVTVSHYRKKNKKKSLKTVTEILEKRSNNKKKFKCNKHFYKQYKQYKSLPLIAQLSIATPHPRW